jgi:hypothetical protein
MSMSFILISIILEIYYISVICFKASSINLKSFSLSIASMFLERLPLI